MMKGLNRVLLNVAMMSIIPGVAGAAGTYYNGNLYRSPQYKSSSDNGGFYNNYGAGRGYGQDERVLSTKTTTVKKPSAKQKNNAKKQGFFLDLGLNKETANWNFSMDKAGSKLHYNDIDWTVLDGEGTYYFDTSTPVQLKVGAKYGVQINESTMTDDDITSGAYKSLYIKEGTVQGHALSIGTSKDGTQYGFNVGLGLTDFWTWGNVKVTPSVGYRYFKYKVETKDTFGMSMDTLANNQTDYISCIQDGGEIQCDPFIELDFYNSSDQLLGYVIPGRIDLGDGTTSDIFFVPTSIVGGTNYIAIDLGDTFYYSQAGTTHKYETTWAGPYVGLDMEYNINENNFVSAGIELGLPVYDSVGDQPYRYDWAHPKSIEDKGKFGDAIHLGLNALWSTAVTDTVMLSFGMTYDYYKVNKATAITYFNGAIYQTYLNDVYAEIAAIEAMSVIDEYYQQLLEYFKLTANDLESLKAQGWSSESKNEIESIYKSMGFRVGVNIKF